MKMSAGGEDCGVCPARAAVEIRLRDPQALRELVDALSERVDFVVKAIPPDRVAMSVLGSFSDGGEEELRLFLQKWQAARPAGDVQVETGDLGPATVIALPRPVAVGTDF